jgi:hypothetical protein
MAGAQPGIDPKPPQLNSSLPVSIVSTSARSQSLMAMIHGRIAEVNYGATTINEVLLRTLMASLCCNSASAWLPVGTQHALHHERP